MSEANRPSGEAGAANGQVAQHAGRDPDAAVHLAPAPDPWFDPEPARQAEQADGGVAVAAADSHQAEWFLPTGRAGLLPESMEESWDETAHTPEPPAVSAKPPWAGERPEVSGDAPPPWESGPWPEPGQGRPEPKAEPAAPAEQPAVPGGPADTGNWPAAAAAAAGILPLVLPGVVLGILGLRRAAVTGTGRAGSWAGIGLSVIWAVVLIVLLAGGGGQAGQGCGNYQNSVNRPVAVVLRDLAGNAPLSVLSQDLHTAITQVNAAAADDQQVAARDVLVSLTSGLEQALTAATEDHSAASYTAIRTQLASDSSAATAACGG